MARARRAHAVSRGAVLLGRGAAFPRPPSQRTTGAGRGRDGPGRGLRHGVDRSHLRPARADRGGLAARAGHGRLAGAAAPVVLSADDPPAHAVRGAGEARPALGASRGRPGDALRAHAPLPRGCGLRGVRGLQLRARPGPPVAAQSQVLGPHAVPRPRPVGALARRRRSAARSAPAARRWWNERGTPRWERRLAAGERPIEAQEVLGPKDLAAEALLLGLRTTAGIDLDGFTARYGVDLLAANDTLVARLVDEGRIVVRADAEGGRWLVPTLSGLAVADGLAAAFDVPLPSRRGP